ncbi:hypothetical protein [Nonomuraea sp. NEAU-A123]|uniref:hypothetical protein n=1 Tax=Nonomuraea sp. NEAU-A123 TaxID=2839649 RepID=UPI001BE49809|nr:hypothetical protein [Nonomuraea sp. NEAU-A123]MBT2234412.1 hypothetical protein [Nonomuraea sp. NEAU-A123]
MELAVRSYEPVARNHLDRLAEIVAAELRRFVQRCPEFQDRMIASVLAQGAALHMLTGATGVKDLDVWMFFAALPGRRFPEYSQLVMRYDFGPSNLGRQDYRLADARNDRERRLWASWASEHQGRRVDVMKRALQDPPDDDPATAIQSWLRAGQRRGRGSAFFLARKPMVLIDPLPRRHEIIWCGDHVAVGPADT